MATNYVEPEELAAYLRIPDGDTEDDRQLFLAISAASKAVDNACRREFDSVGPATRLFTARVGGAGRWVVDTDDMATAPASVDADFAGDGTFSTPVTGWTATPANAVVEPFTGIESRTALPVAPYSVRVTATWGWMSVPDAVVQATLIQAARFMQRRDSPYGIAGSPDAGNELRLLAKVDPDVAVILRPFTRRWWAV